MQSVYQNLIIFRFAGGCGRVYRYSVFIFITMVRSFDGFDCFQSIRYVFFLAKHSLFVFLLPFLVILMLDIHWFRLYPLIRLWYIVSSYRSEVFAFEFYHSIQCSMLNAQWMNWNVKYRMRHVNIQFIWNFEMDSNIKSVSFFFLFHKIIRTVVRSRKTDGRLWE